MTKRRRGHDELQSQRLHHHQQDDDFIPLPIQTFLWRQTSPFVRPFLGKARDLAQIEQRDACKLFERIIITNNIFGQSPSLTDAISSIDRWRLIKVSFPFVLQCTSSLLNSKLIKDHNFNRLGGNEAKMMYTLQWILMNACEECADSENEAKNKATSVALAAAQAASLMKPSNTSDQQHKQQQQQQQEPAGRVSSTSSCGPANQSIMLPAAAMAAVAFAQPAGASTIRSQLQQTVQTGGVVVSSSSSVSPIGSSTPTKPLTPTTLVGGAAATASSSPMQLINVNSSGNQYLLPIASIQMFVYYFAPIMDGLKHSDFLSSNQRLEIGAALWEPLFNHLMPDIHCLTAQVQASSSDTIESCPIVSSKSAGASLVAKRDAPNAFFATAPSTSAATSTAAGAGATPSASRQTISGKMAEFPGTAPMAATPDHRRRSSSIVPEPSHYGDVFLGGPSVPPGHPSGASGCAANASSSARDAQTTGLDSIAPTSRAAHLEQAELVTRVQSQATYLDVAVLRCLFSTDWQESGVYWAIKYLSNRFNEELYTKWPQTRDNFSGSDLQRARSKSLSCLCPNDYHRSLALKRAKFEHSKQIGNSQTSSSGPSRERASSKLASQDNESFDSGHDPVHEALKVGSRGIQSGGRAFLRVEDAAADDPGSTAESSKEPRSPVRRLSFSSGMQTLANQIRKTSKRVKKSSQEQQQQNSSKDEGGSQLSINHYHNQIGSGPLRARRSSSADDLSSGQLSALSSLQKECFTHDQKMMTESQPVITVTPQTTSSTASKVPRPLSNSKNKPFSRRASRDQQREPMSMEHEYSAQLEELGRQSSQDKQYLMQSLHSRSSKILDKLTRSQTIPRNMHFSPAEVQRHSSDKSDSLGASYYVDDQGRIDPLVVLKVLHSISQRENACSMRVCDRMLFLLTRLINMGILHEGYTAHRRSSNQQKDLSNLLASSCNTKFRNDQVTSSASDIAQRILLVHKILVDIVFRMQHHLGCPNQCGLESTVAMHFLSDHRQKLPSFSDKISSTGSSNDFASSSKLLRAQLREALEILCQFNQANFVSYIQDVFTGRPLRQVIDLLHSILGFCRSDYHLTHLKYPKDLADHHQQQKPPKKESQQTSIVQFAERENECPKPKAATSLTFKASLSKQALGAASGTSALKKSSETVESIILSHSFKQLITRIASMTKELKFQENTALYFDIRRLISFIREHYSSTFRTIVLSALIDCTKLLNQQQQLLNGTSVNFGASKLPRQPQQQHTMAAGHPRGKSIDQQVHLQSDDDSSSSALDSSRRTVVASGQREDSLASEVYQMRQSSDAQITISSSVTNDPFELQQHRTSLGSHKGFMHMPTSSKVSQLAGVNLPIGQQRPMSPLSQDSKQEQATASGILSLSKAKRKLEQVFGSGSKQSASGKLDRKQTDESGVVGGYQSGPEDQAAESENTRRASTIGQQSMGSLQHHQNTDSCDGQVHALSLAPHLGPHLSIQLIKQNQLIYSAVHLGMSNFSFLMDSCLPGDFLDPALLAALLDLKSPIAIRAAIFLECANFVHRCNRGQWPSWMRMNWQQQHTHQHQYAHAAQHHQQAAGGPGTFYQPQLHHRGSNAGLLQSSTSASKYRKSSSIQRTARNNTLMYRSAGRAFYAWAEAVGTRLEELLQQEERDSCELVFTPALDTAPDSGDQLSNSSLAWAEYHQNVSTCETSTAAGTLDFLQSSINSESSPFALKMAACQLLFEVTTFLRETFRYLPPTIVQHQVIGTKTGDKMSSIYDVSRAVTANRRWSMALSSLGFGQLPAALSALSAGAGSSSSTQHGPSPSTTSSHLRNPISTAPIPEQPERRISFILHETKDEEEEDNSHQQQQNKDSVSQNSSSTNQDGLSSSVQVAVPSAGSSVISEQQDHARKGAVVAGRHLSQSSASSAVAVAAATLLRSSGLIDGQSHRRKSIKLKKMSDKDREKQEKKAKFAQDLDEEAESSSISDVGVRRTDSIRSRRRVSGISERSDTSDTAQHQQHQQQQAELSGNESGGNGSEDVHLQATAGLGGSGYAGAGMSSSQTEALHGGTAPVGGDRNFEADETRIMSNMPWFKAISLLNAKIDCNCSHFPTCRTNCYKQHQIMCKRLVSFVQTIYQDPTEPDKVSNVFEKQLACLISNEHTKAKQQNVFRAGSDCSSQQNAHQRQSADFAEHNQAHSSGKGNKKFKSKSRHHDHIEDHSSPKVSQLAFQKGAKLHQSRSSSCKANDLAMSSLMNDTMNALRAAKAKERGLEEPQIIKYLKFSVKSLLHCPMSAFLKGAIILPRDSFNEMIRFSWNLLLEDDQQLSRTAAVCFIISSIKCPAEATKLLIEELESNDASKKMAAINKFYVVWDARYQCWPRLEDGAFVHFKMAPPSIEFTLPSPKIAQESSTVVDPPWMPRKTSNVEEVTIGQDQTVQKSFVTATKTRRKQQIELVTKALREKQDKLREDREKYHITSVPLTLYAAFEPTLGSQSGAGGMGGDELEGAGNPAGVGGATSGGAGTGVGDDDQQESRALLQMKTAQALFPTCLCQAAIVMINLLDDPRVTYEGSAVYEIASKVIWSCLVEDPALFLRYFFERLTRQNQNTIFQVLRRLIRFMPRLPPQAAYTLYNYLIGFIIYYIRCPFENSQKLIADTLSVLCLVVPSVHGLFLKDLKQILRKEQCDHNLLITANVPSAKKIIVHGSDSSGIPSQFPIDESTQFYHILLDSLEFFGIEKEKQNEYFLIDVRTNLMHNLHSYVRDYYSFKRSQHPQLQLINMDPRKAFDILQRQELINQFMEFGKVSMSLSVVKSSHMAVQRVLFLHEELMKLPTFPRKALETNFSLFRGPLGHQVFSMDRIHKICWVQVIARMFELTSGFFLQLGDIQLFLNAISGIFVLHCEEASVSRLCLATFINATHQFKSIFATDGFMPIMATMMQVYSNHQNNQLLCRSIEFVCKQFYIMHRKPFLLQLFGSVASRLNTAEILQQNFQTSSPIGVNQQVFSPANYYSINSPASSVADPNRISPTAFFKLLQSLEKAFKDPLDILELVDAEKPLRAVDFCYQQDKESIEILDIISLCVTVTAYASESPRSTQMLIILETVVPLYMKHLQASTSKRAGQSMGKQAHKDELQKIQSISICIRTLIVNCEGLTRNFSGPLPAFDFRSSSIRRTAAAATSTKGSSKNAAGSPMDIHNDEPSNTDQPPANTSRSVCSGARGGSGSNKQATFAVGSSGGNTGGANQNSSSVVGSELSRGARGAAGNSATSDENEITRGEFIVPRDTLLNLVAEFLSLSTGRLVESAKKYVDLHQKHSSYELLDVKSHLRLAEVANSLLKFASIDPSVMACRGLIRYMNEILPNTEWRQEAIRPALIMILKRLDKTFNRIAKKNWVRKSTDWEAAKQLLKGAYLTFIKHPYIVHLPHLKSLISCCQNIILSDGGMQSPYPPGLGSNLFNLTVGGQTTMSGATSNSQIVASAHPDSSQTQSTTTVGRLEQQHQRANLLLPNQQANISRQSPSSSEAPTTAPGQSGPSLAALTAAATIAERLASNTTANSSTSHGFNSVTIRLIAMQLLQTGDSQTLESFVGNLMNTPEKLESLMLNLIYPMCIRVCSGAREAPKLRPCDVMFILNIVLNLLAPQSASSKSCSSQASSPKVTIDTSQFILSKITTTIGSTQTGATALGIVSGSSAHSASGTHHPIAQHPKSLKIGFLGLKILCVCFEPQLATEWIRISRVIRDLSMSPGQPSGPLWDFLDFVATYRFPMYILLLPTIRCQLARRIRSTGDEQHQCEAQNMAHYSQCLKMIEEKIRGPAPTVCRSRSFLFVSLTAELRMLKEQLIAKRKQMLEGERQSNMAASGAGQQQQGSGSGGTAARAGGGTAGSAHQTGTGVGSASSGGQGSQGEQGEHSFTAYHRLSAAIASFAAQGTSGQGSRAAGNGGQLGTSAAIKGAACFAAQLATSAPIANLNIQYPPGTDENQQPKIESGQSSIRLSTAKSREEARRVMNTILRRTSYPHNQSPNVLGETTGNSQQQSRKPSGQPGGDLEACQQHSGESHQIIMDPAMLMAAAFPAPKKSNVSGSGILKQLVQTIDRQNDEKQRQQQQPQQHVNLDQARQTSHTHDKKSS